MSLLNAFLAESLSEKAGKSEQPSLLLPSSTKRVLGFSCSLVVVDDASQAETQQTAKLGKTLSRSGSTTGRSQAVSRSHERRKDQQGAKRHRGAHCAFCSIRNICFLHFDTPIQRIQHSQHIQHTHPSRPPTTGQCNATIMLRRCSPSVTDRIQATGLHVKLALGSNRSFSYLQVYPWRSSRNVRPCQQFDPDRDVLDLDDEATSPG